MGPVGWLAAVPALFRSTLAGLVAPMQSIAGATGIIALSLIPALAAPLQAADAAPANASGLDGGHMGASGTVAAPGANGHSKPAAPRKAKASTSSSPPGAAARANAGPPAPATPPPH